MEAGLCLGFLVKLALWMLGLGRYEKMLVEKRRVDLAWRPLQMKELKEMNSMPLLEMRPSWKDSSLGFPAVPQIKSLRLPLLEETKETKTLLQAVKAQGFS